MGQAASTAATAAAKRSSGAAARATRAAAEAEWEKSTSAAADAAHDYIANQRDGGRRREDRSSAAAAAAAAASSGQRGGAADDSKGYDAVPEMPPELLKFLTDAGPLTRTVDKERTSPRVYESLVKDGEKARDEQARQANRRVRRKMPIMSSHVRGGDVGGSGASQEVEDGTMVERSTNFSTTDRSALRGDGAGLGLSREDLFAFHEKLKGVALDTPQWKAALEKEYNTATSGSKSSSSKGFDQLKERVLFENSLRYIGVPVLMKDTEGDIIGAWPSKVGNLKFSGLKVVPEGRLQFSFLQEGGATNDS